MPKVTEEDTLFATRLGAMLTQLRARSGWTIPDAAEAIGVTEYSLGRWERGENAPKGYNLGKLYRGYVRFGAQWEWFFDPPEVVELTP